MATVLFRQGNILQNGADLSVIPCSSGGHVSKSARAHIDRFGLPLPSKKSLGTIEVAKFTGEGTIARFFAWAASVMDYKSDSKIIESIGRHLGEFANKYPNIQVIETPLLGTGSGGLDSIESGKALGRGFLSTCGTDATLFVYAEEFTTINQLRMTQKDDFLEKLIDWKNQLSTDVIGHFRSNNRERGNLAFDRWKRGFTAFLAEAAPAEAVNFTQKIRMRGMFLIGRAGETAFDSFMRDDGNFCIAFIDDLAEAAKKNQIVLSHKKNPKIVMGESAESSSPVAEEESRKQVFISYSHQDREWLEEFQRMLKPLVRKGKLSIWADTDIKAGNKWKEEIELALATAKIAVLLVSPHFLESDFIANHELPPLLDAAEHDGLTILWVCVGDCLYDKTEIGAYQAAHDPARPLDTLNRGERNSEIAAICRKLAKEIR